MNNYSNYHNANFKDKVFRDSNIMLERQLNGLEGIDALVDGISKRIVAQSKYDSEDKMKIIAKTQDFDTGSLFEFSNKKWLCIGIPVDNEISCIGTVQLCNNTLLIQTGTTKTISGYDPMGRPIYVEQPIDSTFPAIVQSRLYLTENNEQVNIPDGRLHITVKYNNTIKKGMTFTMYGDKYQINGIDYSNTINGKGTITLFADMM